MKVRNISWSIKKIEQLQSKINPRPQYQRGEVWKLKSKQLLIDSILCHFDIPKIYLHDMKGIGQFDYDVTDGQQRLGTLWEFLQDGFPLGDNSYQPDAEWIGKLFSELPPKFRNKIRKFKLVVALISGSTNDEVRELFSRLQRGSRLTPPELRNSIPSQLGDVIRSIADNHIFFTDEECPYNDERFQHQDLCSHAFAIELYKGAKDLKAPNLKEMYESFAQHFPHSAAKKVGEVLTIMHGLQEKEPKSIRTKWGFVDLYWFITERIKHIDSAQLAKKYVRFEQRRREHTAKPELLLTKHNGQPSTQDRRLYDYIIAFKASAGEADNVQKRHQVFLKEFE